MPVTGRGGAERGEKKEREGEEKKRGRASQDEGKKETSDECLGLEKKERAVERQNDSRENIVYVTNTGKGNGKETEREKRDQSTHTLSR